MDPLSALQDYTEQVSYIFHLRARPVSLNRTHPCLLSTGLAVSDSISHSSHRQLPNPAIILTPLPLDTIFVKIPFAKALLRTGPEVGRYNKVSRQLSAVNILLVLAKLVHLQYVWKFASFQIYYQV